MLRGENNKLSKAALLWVKTPPVIITPQILKKIKYCSTSLTVAKITLLTRNQPHTIPKINNRFKVPTYFIYIRSYWDSRFRYVFYINLQLLKCLRDLTNIRSVTAPQNALAPALPILAS